MLFRNVTSSWLVFLTTLVLWIGVIKCKQCRLKQYPYTSALRTLVEAYQSSPLDSSYNPKADVTNSTDGPELTARNIGFLPKFTDLAKLNITTTPTSYIPIVIIKPFGSRPPGLPGAGPSSEEIKEIPKKYTSEVKKSFKVLAAITKTHFSCYAALPMDTSDLAPVRDFC